VNADGSINVDNLQDDEPTIAEMFPLLSFFLHRPLVANPPMCQLKELSSEYSLDDVLIMHEILDLKEHMQPKE
jgi:hypothetical protein